MEDYIFLLIAIALSVYGAINQNRKKKAADLPLEAQEEEPRNFFMDQFLGKDFLDETEEVAPPVKAKPVAPKIHFKSGYELKKEEKSQMRFKSTLPEMKKRQPISAIKKQNEEEEIAESEEAGSYLEDFSLRKAIIYSQILERKY